MALAASIGTGHSVPVTFQYSSSYASTIPFLALVRLVEEEALPHLIRELDGAHGVLGVRDPDLDLDVVSVALRLVPEGVPRLVRHRFDGEPESAAQTGRPVLDGDRPEDPVVAALEARANRLGHLDRAALEDADVGVKALQSPGTAVLGAPRGWGGEAEADEGRRGDERGPGRRAGHPPVASPGHEKFTLGPSR